MQEVQQKFSQQGYIGNPSIYTSLFLAQQLQKPLLIEGPPGVGKTEIAKVLAKIHDTELIRLQCYEGLDANSAIYEWNYQKQLLSIKALISLSVIYASPALKNSWKKKLVMYRK